MDVMHRCCAGLDVHKESVTACVRTLGDVGKVSVEVREFSTMTGGILAMRDWLVDAGVSHVAMEATGVYWKPIWNLLEDGFELMLCNARHVRNVPGRKTDVNDSQWLAQLLQHGLLSPSFVPPRPQRDLRDMTRHRTQLTGEKTRVANRLQKVLEDANIKLASVASDILGKSGRRMLTAMANGENDPAKLADLALRKLRAKLADLEQAFEGGLSPHHRYMLDKLLRHLEFIEQEIEDLDQRIEAQIGSEELNAHVDEDNALPFDQAVELLCTAPGIDRTTAYAIVAEIGTDMDQFPTAANLASWTGLCPGNNESAGKRKSGRTTHGNRWLKRALSQSAWAASHTKNTHLSVRYRQLSKRRGRKRAVVALAHSLCTSIHAMLRTHAPYFELGPDHRDTIAPERRAKYLKKQLQKLGYKVEIEPVQEAA